MPVVVAEVEFGEVVVRIPVVVDVTGPEVGAGVVVPWPLMEVDVIPVAVAVVAGDEVDALVIPEPLTLVASAASSVRPNVLRLHAQSTKTEVSEPPR